MAHCHVVAANELPVCNVSTTTVYTQAPSSGLRRGVVVYLNGLEEKAASQPPPIPVTGEPANFIANLVADQWVVISPGYQEDNYVGPGVLGVYNDVNNDAGFGSRYLTSTGLWWDHVVNYVHQTYGNWPIVVCGFSWGAMKSVQVANLRQSTLTAYQAHCVPTIISNINVLFTPPVNFGTTTTTGLDVTATWLNGVTIPGIVGYGTADIAVGYNSAGTGGTPVSNTDAMITAQQAAQPSHQVVRNATSDTHEWIGADTLDYINWFNTVVDPLCPEVF